MKFWSLAAVLCGCLWGATITTASDSESSPTPQQLRFFEEKVRPLLIEKCLKCHGGEASVRGGLRLNTRETILAGGDSGPAISPEDPGESLLLSAVNYESYEMPPQGKLPQASIDHLARWVEMGAPWPAETTLGHAVEGDEHQPPQVNDEARKFWSFQPVSRPEPPKVRSKEFVSNPIDAFVAARLESQGLTPTPPASKLELIRRAYYDLTGLPPSPQNVADFMANTSPNAYEQLIDQLLDSPHYGERWARHWLDVVRYGESNSYERDDAKPHVWRYRDYVIRSFNNDKPFDRFVLEQLAGDELETSDTDSKIATGYYRLGVWQDEPVDPVQEEFEDFDDLVRTTSEVFLGLTMGCARCHDHKLDPIPQRDYYRFVAFFRNVRRFGTRSPDSVIDASVIPIGTPEAVAEYQAEVAAHRTATDNNRQEIGALERRVRRALQGVDRDEWKTEDARPEIVAKLVGDVVTAEESRRYAELAKKRKDLRNFKPPGMEHALVVKEHGPSAPDTHVLIRGNAHAQGDKVSPGIPSVLPAATLDIVRPAAAATTGRRLALAKWIASADNPLTARVLVNRVWHYHFGRGLVRTPNDFGFAGAPPTHPQLLDWLADEFVARGWRIKQLHKLIMLSSTYQMSSRSNPEALAQDPTNDLFWRFNMRRLSAEEIRDSILDVTGELNRTAMFGPSIYTKLPQEVFASQSRPGNGWGKSSPEQQARRSIYIHVKRSLAVPLLAAFDGPETDASCPVRFATTQPTQALGMLNSDFIQERAERFRDDLAAEAGGEVQAQVELGLRRVLQRDPGEDEVKRALDLVQTLREDLQLDQRAAMKQLCVTLLNLNEFVYLD